MVAFCTKLQINETVVIPLECPFRYFCVWKITAKFNNYET